MERYQLLARVQHSVTDVITLNVDAETVEEAFTKAKAVLSVFPRPSDEPGVPYCYVEHRVFNDSEIKHIEVMDEDDS
jgi:hypothetical protein